MDYKKFNAHILETKENGNQGIVTAFISTFGNVDYVGDKVAKEAFDRTLKSGRAVKVCDNHNLNSVLNIVAKNISLEAIKQRSLLPEKIQKLDPNITGGLKATMQFYLDDDISKGVFFRLKNGLIDSFSIGYQTVKSHTEKTAKGLIRVLDDIELFEYSAVINPANSAAVMVDAKTASSRRAKLAEIEKHLVDLKRTKTLEQIGLHQKQLMLTELDRIIKGVS